MAQMKLSAQSLGVLDQLIAFIWVTPLTVCFWRATWILLDLYILPDDIYIGSWITFVAGSLTCSLINILQPFFDCVCDGKGKLLFVLVCQIQIYVFSVMTVSHWRGTWNLTDHYTGITWSSNVIVLTSALFLLFLFLSVSSVMAVPPLTLIADTHQPFFSSIPRFRTNVSRRFPSLCVRANMKEYLKTLC